jgi:acyl carrier protein
MGIQTSNSAEIQQILKDYLLRDSTPADAQKLGADDNLLEAGVLDSLGIAEVTEYIEKTFGITIDEDEISAKNYRSLNSLTAFCQSKMTSAATS